MPTPNHDQLAEARAWLRAEQAAAATAAHWSQPTRAEDVTEDTLTLLRERCKFLETDDPHVVRRGAFMFERQAEEERIRVAEALVRRVQPGPFEDPNYFALLAYQAASLEAAWPKKDSAPFAHYVLGTVHRADVNAFALRLPSSTVVGLHSGIIDFVYQAAKVVVAASNPFQPNDGETTVRATIAREKIRAYLASDPAPVERLYRTLESYFFHGYPRAFSGEPVKEAHAPPLSLLVSMAERWIIAHEYGHGMVRNRPFHHAPVNPVWAEEFFADTQAAILTVTSAHVLDHVGPEIALAGGNFALACLDLLRRAHCILTTGKESSDKEDPSHPPNKERAEQNISSFRQFFDVNYRSDGTCDLKLVARQEPPKDHAFGAEHRERVYAWSWTLFDVWHKVREMLYAQYEAQRPMHVMWRS